jgi:hypothetical protein
VALVLERMKEHDCIQLLVESVRLSSLRFDFDCLMMVNWEVYYSSLRDYNLGIPSSVLEQGCIPIVGGGIRRVHGFEILMLLKCTD